MKTKIPVQMISNTVINKFELSEPIRQWVCLVNKFSSQYNNTIYSANQIIGEPKVFPSYGDLPYTWAQSAFRATEFIELEFPHEIVCKKLNIYETFHAGGIVCIKLWKRNTWIPIWQKAKAENIETSRIFSPIIKETRFKTKKVRLEVDCTVANSWCEIDAVEMEGLMPPNNLKMEKDLEVDIQRLLFSPKFSDVQFSVNGEIICAHRNILMAGSEYFKDLFCEDLKCKKANEPIKINDISVLSFKSILLYLYSNSIEADTKPEALCELLKASDKYKVEGLHEKIMTHISAALSIDNVLIFLKESTEKEPRLNDVLSLSLDFIKNNKNQIANFPYLEELPHNVLIEIIRYIAENSQC